MYFSLPVLSGILDETYLSHFAHFVAAIQLLSAGKVSLNDIETAETYTQFSDLYGMCSHL